MTTKEKEIITQFLGALVEPGAVNEESVTELTDAILQSILNCKHKISLKYIILAANPKRDGGSLYQLEERVKAAVKLWLKTH